MQVTNGECWLAGIPQGPGEKAALAVLASLPMPPKTARAVQTLIRKVGEAVTDINAVRVKLAEQHAKRDADGAVMQQDQGYVFDNLVAFLKDWNELLGESITLTGCAPLHDADLGTATLTAATLMQLGPFVVE